MSRYCVDCGYRLDYLTEPRCPECGRTFSPDDPSTFLADLNSLGRKALLVSLGGIGLMVLSLGFAREFARTARPGEWNAWGGIYITLLLSGYLIELAVFFYSSFINLRRRPYWGNRAMGAAWAVSFLAAFGPLFGAIIAGVLGWLPRD